MAKNEETKDDGNRVQLGKDISMRYYIEDLFLGMAAAQRGQPMQPDDPFLEIGEEEEDAAIYIHDIPYEMAKRRNHPHQDAIHVGGWLSLFTLHAIWPLLWIWATLYKPGVGYGFGTTGIGTAASEAEVEKLKETINALQDRVASLERRSEGEDAS